MGKKIWPILLILCLLLSGCGASQPPGRQGGAAGALRGNVTGQDAGAAISGAQVTLEQNGQTITTVTTDSAGNYQVTDLPVGSYTVTVLAHGYESAAPATVTVIENIAVQQNFTLTQESLDLDTYAEFLRQRISQDTTFQLAYVDGDDIPELIIGNLAITHSDTVTFYTCQNGTVVELGEALSCSFVPKQNWVISEFITYAPTANSTKWYYKIENGKLVQVSTLGMESTTASFSNGVCTYYQDGKAISKDEYDKMVQAYSGDGNAKLLTGPGGWVISETNIRKMLTNPADTTRG